MSGAPDFAVIGGGIVGCSLAAFLAEAGASVVLYEREAIAAGASGRNSGVVQHPLDAAARRPLRGVARALPDARARLLAARGPRRPAARLRPAEPRRRAVEFPELHPTLPRRRRAARGRARARRGPVRLAAGDRPPRPAGRGGEGVRRCARTRRARRCGSARPRSPHVEDGRATGVTIDGAHHPAGAVAIAAGPWTPEPSAAGLAPFISPLWGVVVELELPDAPRHVLEEAGIEALTSGEGRRGRSSRRSRRAGSRRSGRRSRRRAGRRTRWRRRC